MADRTLAIYAEQLIGKVAKFEINGPTIDKWWSRTVTNGYASFQIDDSLGDSGIRITADGFKPYNHGFHFHTVGDPQHWGVPMNQQVNVGVQIPLLEPETQPRIWATANGLVDDTGKPFLWLGADSFRLHERVLLGEDVSLHLDQMRDCGVTVLRVLMDASWFRVTSRQRPDTYSHDRWFGRAARVVPPVVCLCRPPRGVGQQRRSDGYPPRPDGAGND
jgi:hypothetical protein